jgi:cell wall-associated NlpC family hydrolase
VSADDVEILRRAHVLFEGVLFDGHPTAPVFDAPPPVRAQPANTGLMAATYSAAASDWLDELRAARQVDTRLERIMAEAYRDHADARSRTGAVLAAARSDATTYPTNPVAARELLRRRLIRLHHQQAHVRTARTRATRHRSALRGLHYRAHRAAGRDSRGVLAVRAALSRLGTPYVWGASGPNRFDCSGLVQWSYAQAGIRLRRTTYEQIHQGVPVAPSQVRPGDLVFPHTGHVQLAIGGGLVIEAPQPGSVVQISRMGPSVAIRRVA